MPLYRYECPDCGEVTEVIHSINELGQPRYHACGKAMILKPSGFSFTFRVNNRGRVLKALNGEVPLPATPQDRPRIEKALAKGLNREKPVIGVGI